MVGGGVFPESDSGQPRSKNAIENTRGSTAPCAGMLMDKLGRILVDEGHSAVRWAASAQRVMCFLEDGGGWGFNGDLDVVIDVW